MIPFIHEIGHIIILLVLGYQIIDVKIGVNIFQNSYVMFLYEELTYSEALLIFGGGVNILMFLGLLGLFIKNIWYKAFAISCLADNIMYGFLGTTGCYGDFYVVSYIMGSLLSLIIYVIFQFLIIFFIIYNYHTKKDEEKVKQIAPKKR